MLLTKDMIVIEVIPIVFVIIMSLGCLLIVYIKCLLLQDDQYRNDDDKYQSFSEELLEDEDRI